MEIIGLRPPVSVQPEEFIRLLGYPRGHVLAGRAVELAEAAAEWYRLHGVPWMYAREAANFELGDSSFMIDERVFNGAGLRRTLASANATTVVVAAVSAGAEVEAETNRLWLEEKPDEYFFLEVYGSAVVEHLVTTLGARLCALAEGEGRAVLPHYSPGYPGWEIAEQARLLTVLEGGTALPGALDVMESGMLRPKKSLLAVFGVTHQTERVKSLDELNPCTGCSLPNCQYRRVAYRRPVPRVLAEI